jgi:hypothetical protein
VKIPGGFPAFLIASLSSASWAGSSCVVPEALWQAPRSGEAVLREAGIGPCVNLLLDTPRARLVIRHGSGDASSSRAAELRYWLLALGLEKERLLLDGRQAGEAPLQVEVLEEQ